MDSEVVLQLECTQGEDVAWQIFWADEYNRPVPITDPVLCDVKDANGQIALRFSSNGTPETQATITLSAANGFMQLTAPAALMRTLVPGRYEFDIFGSVADSATPFAHQLVQIIGGWLLVESRVTIIELAPEATLSSMPG
jgi:hypothetical protein